MPNQPDRTKHEQALTAAVHGVFSWHRASWPNISWTDLQDDLAEALQPGLARVYAESRERAGERFDLPDAGIDQKAKAWAGRYGSALATAIVANTRSKGADADADVWLGGERAQRIGVTEVTRAITAGEVGIIALLLMLRPDYEGPWWETESRNPCPVCQSLDGEPRRVWAERFPEGPPGPHPGCFCALRWD